jgi:hypothetical protein
MSWSESLKSYFIIETGDGVRYYPEWMNASKSLEFNVSEFEFPELEGTKVDRRKLKGRKFDIEIYFQGDDHLDVAGNFDISSRDERPWKVSHPLYGQLLVAPTVLNFDDSKYNVTKITGTLIETLSDDSPKTSLEPVDNINYNKGQVDSKFSNAFSSRVKLSSRDLTLLAASNKQIYNQGSKFIKVSVNAQEYFNLFQVANSKVLNATAEPLAAIQAVQSMINYPGILADNAGNRLSLLSGQFNLLRLSVDNFSLPSEKMIFEHNAGSIVSTMASSSANPTSEDYKSRDEVISSIETILNSYNQYLTDLDTLQTDTGGETDSYIPDADALQGLSDLIHYTVSNLFNIALNSKQERSIILEDDSNVILLAHRFYGLDDSDSSIDQIIENNNIGINELLEVKKGRKILYYV